MITDGKMDVQLDVSKASRVSRLEVIEGPTGRRNRSAAPPGSLFTLPLPQPSLYPLTFLLG